MARIGRAVVAAALAVGVSAATCTALAQQRGTEQPKQQGDQIPAGPTAAPAEAPAAAAAQIITAAATVQKVDKAKGTVTLKDADGNTFEMKAGPHIDMDKLHVGDRVTAKYYEEIAVAISKASQGAPKMTETTVERGGVTARQATVTAHIVSVDPKKNAVVIRAPDGSTHTLKVEDPALQGQLKQIKPGDSLDITYTQAVALSVEPRK